MLTELQVSTLWWMFDIGQYTNTNSPAKHLQAARCMRKNILAVRGIASLSPKGRGGTQSEL